jgi:hypothetical protein
MNCVVAATSSVLIQNCENCALVEQASLAGLFVGQCIVEQFSQFAVEPFADRHTESRFGR